MCPIDVRSRRRFGLLTEQTTFGSSVGPKIECAIALERFWVLFAPVFRMDSATMLEHAQKVMAVAETVSGRLGEMGGSG